MEMPLLQDALAGDKASHQRTVADRSTFHGVTTGRHPITRLLIDLQDGAGAFVEGGGYGLATVPMLVAPRRSLTDCACLRGPTLVVPARPVSCTLTVRYR